MSTIFPFYIDWEWERRRQNSQTRLVEGFRTHLQSLHRLKRLEKKESDARQNWMMQDRIERKFHKKDLRKLWKDTGNHKWPHCILARSCNALKIGRNKPNSQKEKSVRRRGGILRRGDRRDKKNAHEGRDERNRAADSEPRGCSSTVRCSRDLSKFPFNYSTISPFSKIITDIDWHIALAFSPLNLLTWHYWNLGYGMKVHIPSLACIADKEWVN